MLKQLSKRLIEGALVGELKSHLEESDTLFEEHANAQSEAVKRNSRNGYSAKTLQSEQGEMEIAISRDRIGKFEPILIPKHQRRMAGIDEKILAMKGMGVRDISAQLEELYEAKVSAAVSSEVTDSVSEEVKAWQCRPLDEVYPIVYLDALYTNIKVSGRVGKRAVYVVLGINREGNKDLLGLWIGEAKVEGAWKSSLSLFCYLISRTF